MKSKQAVLFRIEDLELFYDILDCHAVSLNCDICCDNDKTGEKQKELQRVTDLKGHIGWYLRDD